MEILVGTSMSETTGRVRDYDCQLRQQWRQRAVDVRAIPHHAITYWEVSVISISVGVQSIPRGSSHARAAAGASVGGAERLVKTIRVRNEFAVAASRNFALAPSGRTVYDSMTPQCSR